MADPNRHEVRRVIRQTLESIAHNQTESPEFTNPTDRTEEGQKELTLMNPTGRVPRLTPFVAASGIWAGYYLFQLMLVDGHSIKLRPHDLYELLRLLYSWTAQAAERGFQIEYQQEYEGDVQDTLKPIMSKTKTLGSALVLGAASKAAAWWTFGSEAASIQERARYTLAKRAASVASKALKNVNFQHTSDYVIYAVQTFAWLLAMTSLSEYALQTFAGETPMLNMGDTLNITRVPGFTNKIETTERSIGDALRTFGGKESLSTTATGITGTKTDIENIITKTLNDPNFENAVFHGQYKSNFIRNSGVVEFNPTSITAKEVTDRVADLRVTTVDELLKASKNTNSGDSKVKTPFSSTEHMVVAVDYQKMIEGKHSTEWLYKILDPEGAPNVDTQVAEAWGKKGEHEQNLMTSNIGEKEINGDIVNLIVSKDGFPVLTPQDGQRRDTTEYIRNHLTISIGGDDPFLTLTRGRPYVSKGVVLFCAAVKLGLNKLYHDYDHQYDVEKHRGRVTIKIPPTSTARMGGSQEVVCDVNLAEAFKIAVTAFYENGYVWSEREHVKTAVTNVFNSINQEVLYHTDGYAGTLIRVLSVYQDGGSLDKGSDESIFRQYLAKLTGIYQLMVCTYFDVRTPSGQQLHGETRCAICGLIIIENEGHYVRYSTEGGVIYPYAHLDLHAAGTRHYAHEGCFQKRFQQTIEQELQLITIPDEALKIKIITDTVLDIIIGTQRPTTQRRGLFSRFFSSREPLNIYVGLQDNVTRRVTELVRNPRAAAPWWAAVIREAMDSYDATFPN